MRGHITYHITPMRQRLFYGFFTQMPGKFVRKVRANWLRAGPGLVGGYLLWQWLQYRHDQELRHHWD
jgi:hypothetical protein